jgi:hypothetical protein
VEVKPQTVKVALKIEEAHMDILNMTDSERKSAKKRYSQHFLLGKEKREGDIVTCQGNKIINAHYSCGIQ